MKKKICVVTGCRSDYGLLLPLLREIKAEKDFNLQIIAAGSHLLREFGLTYKLIEEDGFRISEKVKIRLHDDTGAGIAKASGYALAGFSGAFARLKPDLVLVLGDRFEIFSATASAFLSGIPIAHIHGGELTEGSIDDGLRHAITKFSVLHFCSTPVYRKRVIQLGEDPANVYNVGALGIDNIRGLKLLDKGCLEDELSFRFGKKTALVTFYPSTSEPGNTGREFRELLIALDEFKDLKVIFTKPAADINARIIAGLIDRYVSRRPGKAAAFTSLGQVKYLSAMKYADVVAGNSSSGIIEAPSFRKPAVNIGTREKGRVAAKSVINCGPSRKSIISAFKKAFSKNHKELSEKADNPYGEGRAANKIYKILKGRLKHEISVKKTFHDKELK